MYTKVGFLAIAIALNSVVGMPTRDMGTLAGEKPPAASNSILTKKNVTASSVSRGGARIPHGAMTCKYEPTTIRYQDCIQTDGGAWLWEDVKEACDADSRCSHISVWGGYSAQWAKNDCWDMAISGSYKTMGAPSEDAFVKKSCE
jgi:hypothetical protein